MEILIHVAVGTIGFTLGFFVALMFIKEPNDYKCDCANPQWCDKDCPPKEMYRKTHG